MEATNQPDDSLQSQGGKARAAKLSNEQKKEIATRAANARWGKGLPQASHVGDLQINGRPISAAVLPNGTRLITQGTFLLAIGRSRTPKAGTGGLSNVDALPFFLQAEQLSPYISEELRMSTAPILFRLPTGQKAVGYDARLLPMVCEVYLKYRDDIVARKKPVPTQYEHIVAACDLLMRGLAQVGIIALVDEATGYQEERAKNALALILEEFISKELRAWTRTFPVEFYRQIFRLKGWKFDLSSVKRPSVIGHYTNNFVYKRLAPGVLKELRDKNPVVDGRRKHKLFQWLTGDVGDPKLRAHLEGVIRLMSGCTSWREFREFLDRFYPVIETTDLGFEIEIGNKPTSLLARKPSGQPSPESSRTLPGLI